MKTISIVTLLVFLFFSSFVKADWVHDCFYGSLPPSSLNPTVYCLTEIDGSEGLLTSNGYTLMGANVFGSAGNFTDLFSFAHSGFGLKQYYVWLANPPTGSHFWTMNGTANSVASLYIGIGFPPIPIYYPGPGVTDVSFASSAGVVTSI